MFKDIDYIHFEIIGSTNAWAKKHANQLNLKKFTCITASEQTNGRGRFSKKWISPPGQNIYATFFFSILKNSSYLVNLGQILAYSCAVVLKQQGLEAQLKWPNDILVNGKKIAGILCETVELKDGLGIVLGIGVNVNMDENLLQTIDQPATSIAAATGQNWEIKELLESILTQFLQNLEILQKDGFGFFQPSFEKLLAHKGKEIRCQNGLKGICKGISPQGYLELLLPSGDIVLILS